MEAFQRNGIPLIMVLMPLKIFLLVIKRSHRNWYPKSRNIFLPQRLFDWKFVILLQELIKFTSIHKSTVFRFKKLGILNLRFERLFIFFQYSFSVLSILSSKHQIVFTHFRKLQERDFNWSSLISIHALQVTQASMNGRSNEEMFPCTPGKT